MRMILRVMIDICDPKFDAKKVYDEFRKYVLIDNVLPPCDYLDVHFWLQHKFGELRNFNDAKLLISVWEGCGFISYASTEEITNMMVYKLK